MLQINCKTQVLSRKQDRDHGVGAVGERRARQARAALLNVVNREMSLELTISAAARRRVVFMDLDSGKSIKATSRPKKQFTSEKP